MRIRTLPTESLDALQENCEVGVWSIFRLIGIAIWPDS
jgi:hypothetical protein